MDGDWYEERPTLNGGSGWALNPECYYLNLTKSSYNFIGMVNSSRKLVNRTVIMVNSFFSRVDICMKTLREWSFLVDNDFITRNINTSKSSKLSNPEVLNDYFFNTQIGQQFY